MKYHFNITYFFLKTKDAKKILGQLHILKIGLLIGAFLLVLSPLGGCSNDKTSGDQPSSPSTHTSSSDLAKGATKALSAYFQAIRTDNIKQQKALTTDKALRFTLFKELEDSLGSDNKTKTTVATPDMSILTTSENKVTFRGSTIFATVQIGNLSVATSAHKFTDPVMVKNKQGEWKLSDYTRDGKKISDTVYSIEKVTQTENFNIKIIDLLLLPKRSLVEIMVQNKSDDDIITQIESSSLSILGPNDTVSKKMPVQTNDPIIKKFHYINKDEKLTSFLGFGKVPLASRDLSFELVLSSNDIVNIKIGLPSLIPE